MKAAELRIGNWYNEFGIPKQATASTIVAMSQIEAAGKKVIDVSAIPLTEEWLKRFDFKPSSDYDLQKNFIGWTRDGSDYGVAVKSTHHFFLDAGDDNYYRIPVKLEFVHQLQNLYFALTGEELPTQ